MISMIQLDKLIDVKVLQNIQDSFSDTTKISAITVKYNGEPITKPSNFTNFCNMIRKDKKMASMCHKCDAYGGVQSAISGKPHIYKCHAGLYDFAVPIMIEDNYVGAILCGQVKIKDKEDERIGNFGRDTNWSCNKEIHNAYKEIKIKTYKEVEDAANLIYQMSKYMVDSEFLRVVREELNNKSTKLMEEENKRIELERDLKEAELKSLHNQINSHFMFNSINTIANMARLEKAYKTEEFVYNFADMIRYSLRKDNSNTVYLEDELAYIENYLKIQKTRFGNRLEYTLDVDENFYNIKCPYMILQPIIENFIKYVVEPRIHGGKIDITAYKENKKFILDICDNGDGIDKNKIKSILEGIEYIKNKNCIGLYNINKRLTYLYGDEYQLQIHSPNEKDKGTLVRITLPMDKEVIYV
ncbi:histidine kinase [Romboutsia ilealis]|uniref:PocR ligand-binding domain-containing protein n=1 Tax=Romboutsia faecis TaxID=2764597 RepID=A0ABR7JTF1_9FIRM|nr:PocR ligand-binding domain-containing protein [Romboutsia faecis]MBC5997911.1 PocR ligand-binding domain-containing protein [Romboutsia faecis]MRN25606.1 histidine kinase [Romboutsia ilealis]